MVLYYFAALVAVVFLLDKEHIVIVAAIACGLYILYKSSKINPLVTPSPTSPLWAKYNNLVRHKTMTTPLYNIHRGPDKLKYIFIHGDVVSIIEDLDFIMKYQEDILLDFIIYIEYFFKFHYNVMLGKYDACTYIPILKDIQKQIINTLSQTIFNLPNHSTVVDIPNLDSFIAVKRRDILAITTKYILILKHKYASKCRNVASMLEYDPKMEYHMLL